MHDVVATGDAARLLGVGSSSLREWTDTGALPCVRTDGGHRRYRVHDLAAWLEQSGGHLPAPAPRSLVDGRVPADPDVAMAIRRRQAVVVHEAQVLFDAAGTHPVRGAGRRAESVRTAVATLRQGIASGDLRAACHRGAWLGYCASVLGRSSRDVLGPVLAACRASARAVGVGAPGRPVEIVELAMERWAVAIGEGYAAGLRPVAGGGPAPGDGEAAGRWLGLEDASRALGVSRSTLRDWCTTTDVPFIRTKGGHRRFDPQELRAWVASRPEVLSRRRGTWPTVARNREAAAFVGQYGNGIARLAGLPVVEGHTWVSAATDALAAGSLSRARSLAAAGFGFRDALAMERALALAISRANDGVPRPLQLALTGAAQALVVTVADGVPS